MLRKERLSLAAGSGISLNVASVITPSVPREPMYSLHMSYPATFLTTLPPAFVTRPSPVTTLMPIVKSRGVPWA